MDDFVTLGANLKHARESQEMSLEELERRTRIRVKFLEAIENGDFDAIDGQLQMRGFLRNYAHAVGLDGEAVVAFYDQAVANVGKKRRRRRRKKDRREDVVASDIPRLDLQTRPANLDESPPTIPSYSTQPVYSSPATLPAPSRGRGVWRTLRLVLIVIGAGALTALVIGGIVLGINQITEQSEESTPLPPLIEVNPDGQSTDVNSMSGPTNIPTQPGIEIPPPDQNQPSFEGASALFISITAEQRSWLRIQTDGTTVFEGILLPETGVQYSANDRITVRTSNAGGLRVRINNQDYSLGQGRVSAEQTFTLEGLIAPTPAPSLTPTATSTITATFTLPASITATVTNTATNPPPAAAGDTTDNQTSPTATFFFTPLASQPANVPTSLPNPGQVQDTTGPTSLPGPGASSTPTAPANTLIPSMTPLPADTSTPSFTPTVATTPTPFLPPRETRTPIPDK